MPVTSTNFISSNPRINPGGNGVAPSGSTAYERLYNQLVGQMTARNVAGMANGASWQQQRQLYNQSGGGFFNRDQDREPDKPMWTNRQRFQYNNQNQPEEGATYHEADTNESIISNIMDLGNQLLNATGFSRNRQNYGPLDPRTLLSFPATVPAGIFAGMAEAPGQVYEAATGRNVTQGYRSDDGTWYIKDDTLDPGQQVAQGINAAINIGSPLFGGAGDIITTGASAAKAIGSNLLRNSGKGSVRRYSTELGAANAARAAGEDAVQAVNQTTSSIGNSVVGRASRFVNRASNAGREIMDNLPLGVFNRRTSGLRAAEGTAPGALKVMGSDAIEEGVEEFSQSYLEDIRNNQLGDESFGRAVEAALWGAAGGGMMGGAAHLGGQAVARYQQDKDNQTGPGNRPENAQGRTTDVTDTTPTGDGTRQSLGEPSSRFTAFQLSKQVPERDQASTAMNQYLNDKHSRGNQVQGAVPVQLVSGGRMKQNVFVGKDDAGNDLYMQTSPNNSNGDFGEQYFYNLYQTGREGQQRIADEFQLPLDEVHRLFNRERTLENMQENCQVLNRAIYDLKQLSMKNGHWVQPVGAWGKNPATSTHSVVPIYIEYVGVGNFINGDPQTIEVLKSDADGDTLLSSMNAGHAYDAARQHDFTVRSLGMNDSADVVTDMDYASFMDPEREGRARVTNALYDFADALGLQGNRRNQFVTDLRERYTEAYKSRNVQYFANFFNYASNYADRFNGRQLDRNYVSVLTSQLWKDLETPQEFEIIAQEVKNNPQEFSSRSTGKIDQNETRASEKPYAGKEMGYDQSADFSDRNHAVQVVHMLDLRTGFIAGTSGNPVFRQDQSWVQASNVIRIVTDDGIHDVPLDTAEFIAEIRGLLDTGLDPIITITTMFREFVQNETMREYVSRNDRHDAHIRTEEDWTLFQSIFTKHYNHFRGEYEKALKNTAFQDSLTGEYASEFDPLGITPPPEIITEGSGDNERPLAVSFNRAFAMMYGDSRVDFLFDIRPDHIFAGLTFDQMCKHISNGEASAMAFHRNGLNKAVASMVRTFEARVRNCEKSIEQIIDDNVENHSRRLSEDGAVYEDANGVFRVNREYADDFEYLHEYYTALLPPTAFAYFPQLGGRNVGAVNTVVGRTLLTARTGNEAKNALLSIALTTDYFDVLVEMDRLNQTDNLAIRQAIAQNILNALASFQSKSALHRVIFENANDHYQREDYQGMLARLDRLLDETVSYDEKAATIGELTESSLRKNEENRRAEPAPLLTWALADGGSDTHLAALSTRMRKAGTYARHARANSHDALLSIVENEVRGFVEDEGISEKEKVMSIRYAMDTATSEVQKNALYSSIIDGADIFKPNADKISVLDSQQYLYDTLENAIYGSHQQYVEATTNGVCGMVDLSTFQNDTVMLMRICSDPNFRVLVKDDINGGKIYYMSQLVLFESIGERPVNDGQDPTMRFSSKQYLKLFRAYPELCSRMGKTSTSVSMVGRKATFTESRNENIGKTLYDFAYLYRNEIDKAEAMLLRSAEAQAAANDSAFYGWVIMHMPDISKMTDKELYLSIDKAWEDALDYWSWRSTLPYTSAERADLIAETRNNAMLGFLESFRELMASNQTARDMAYRGSHLPAPVRMILGNQIAEINDMLFYAQFTRQFNAPIDPALRTNGEINYQAMFTERDKMVAALEELRLIEMAITSDPLNQGSQAIFSPSEEAMDEVDAIITQMQRDALRITDPNQRRAAVDNARAARAFYEYYRQANQTAEQMMVNEVSTNGVSLNVQYINQVLGNTFTSGVRPVVSPFMLSPLTRNASQISRTQNGVTNQDTFRDNLIRTADDIVYWLGDISRTESIEIVTNKLPDEFQDYRNFFTERTNEIGEANDNITNAALDLDAGLITEDEYNAIVTENREIINDVVNRLNVYCSRFNALITDELVRAETMGTQDQVTQNAGIMVYDLMDAGCRVENAMRRAKTDLARRHGFRDFATRGSSSNRGRAKPPIDIDSFNAANAALAQQVMINVGSAGLASIISSNSQAVGDVGAAALIPMEYNGGKIPEIMTLGELNRILMNGNDDRNLYYVQFVVGEYTQDDFDNGRVPSYLLMRVTEESVNRLIEDETTGIDTPVTVFKRQDAGVYDETGSTVDFTDRDPNEPSQMAVSSHVIKGSKENLAGRLMKNMSSAAAVVSHIDIDDDLNVANPREGISMVTIDTAADEDAAWNNIRNIVKVYRQLLAKRIYQQWRADGITDVSYYDCYMMAEYLVSTVTVSDRPQQGGPVYSTAWLTTDAGNTEHRGLLKQLMDEADARGQHSLCFTVLPLSQHDIAGRVMDAVARWEIDNDREMTRADRQDLTYVLTDFRDRAPLEVVSDAESIADVMRGVVPLGMGVNTNLRLASTRTPGQRMRSSRSPHRTDLNNEIVHEHGITSREYREAVTSVMGRVRLIDEDTGKVIGYDQNEPDPDNWISAVFNSQSVREYGDDDFAWSRAFMPIAGMTRMGEDSDDAVGGDGFVLAVTERDVSKAFLYARTHQRDLLIEESVYNRLRANVASELDPLREETGYIYEYGDGSRKERKRFLLINIRQYLQDEASNNGSFSYQVQQMDPKIYGYRMFDNRRTFQLGDSTSILFENANKYWGSWVEDSLDIPAGDLFDKNGWNHEVHPIDETDLDRIITDRSPAEGGNLFLEYYRGIYDYGTTGNDSSSFDTQAWGRSGLASKVRAYLDKVRDPAIRARDFDGEGFPLSNNYVKGDCIGIVKSTDNSGRTIYAPIFSTKAMPNRIDQGTWGSILRSGLGDDGHFHFDYQTKLQPGEGDFQKSTNERQAGKTNTFASGPERIAPTVANGYQSVNYGMVVPSEIYDGLCIEGRSYGQEPVNAAGSMFNEMQVMGGSLFGYSTDGRTFTPNAQFRDYINRQTVIDPNTGAPVRDNYQALLDDGREGRLVASALVSGDIRFTEEAALNDIYRAVMERCLRGLRAPADYRLVFHPLKIDPETNRFSVNPCYTQIASIFSNFTFDQINRFFHHLSLDCQYVDGANGQSTYCKYCPDGASDIRWARASEQEKTTWRWSCQGEMSYKGKWYPMYFGPPQLMNHTSQVSSVPQISSYSYEHKTFDLMDKKLIPSGRHFGGLLSYYADRFGYFYLYGGEDARGIQYSANANPYGLDAEQTLYDRFGGDEFAYLANSYRRKCVKLGNDTFELPVMIEGDDGLISDLRSDSEIAIRMNTIQEILEMERDITDQEIIYLYMQQIGLTRTTADTANKTAPKSRFLNTLDHMIREMRDDIHPRPLIIYAGRTELQDNEGRERIAIPLIEANIARDLFRDSALLSREYNGSFDAFQREMMRELEEAEEIIETDITDRHKKRALYRFCDYLRVTHGEDVPVDHLYRDQSAYDRAQEQIAWRNISEADPDIRDGFPERIEAARDYQRQRNRNYQNRRREMNRSVRRSGSTRSGVSSHPVAREGFLYWKGWDNLAKVRRTMGVLNPFMPIGNIAGRFVHGGIMNLMLHQSQNQDGIGSWLYHPGIIWTDNGLPNQLANDPRIRKYFNALVAASYSGQIEEVQNLKSEEELDAWIKAQKTREGNPFTYYFNKLEDGIFKLANGFDIGRSIQIENFFNVLASLIGNDNGGVHDLYATTHQLRPNNSETPIEVSDLEMMLQQDAIGTLSELFSGPAGELASRAWNTSLQGDYAQRNVVSEIILHICGRCGLANFLTSAFVSPYITYSTNMAGRVMSAVFPMSSLHYLIVERMADSERFADWNLRDIHTRGSLKEALIADAIHMGPVLLGMYLAVAAMSIAGLFEPPDDEEKICNMNEWKIFGVPVNTAWWAKDILCGALPIAGTLYCALHPDKYGKYAGTVLTQGFSDLLYNNPLFSISNLIESFTEVSDGLLTGKYTDGNDYSKAPGGNPTAFDAWSSQVGAAAINFMTGFVTPSVVKDVYSKWDPLQRSYKEEYQRDANGQILLDPETGEPLTERVSYYEAQLKRLSRNNPFMGMLLNFLNNTNEYTRDGMPPIEIKEPVQMWSANHLSLKNEDGSYKTEAEQQAIAYEVINTLMMNDDMEALWKSGYYIPPETKMFVGKVIYDVVHSLEDNYANLKMNGGFDYYAYGDYRTGEEIVTKAQEAYKAEHDMWTSLYHDKLYSDPMRRPMQTYYLMNQTYQQDINGDWYNSGYRQDPFNILPFTPMSTGEATGEQFGYSTNSVLDDSISTGIRGLLAVNQGYEDKPDWDSLGNGVNGYTNAATGTNGGSWAPGWNGWSGYSGRRSYGGYRRGGGGGGRPSIRSYSPTLNISYPTTMNPSRWYGSQEDYLRPSFETKGSREATRREDF